MTRSVPIIPTVLVVAAAAIMVALGFWQLGRADEKAEMIAKYEEVSAQSTVRESLPRRPVEHLFEKVIYNCEEVLGMSSIAGRNRNGQTGFAHVARCRGRYLTKDQGNVVDVTVGWSRRPQGPAWGGGKVEGVISRGGELGWRLVLEEPIGDLQPNAKPDPGDLPNNHLAYAGQWFFFALTALVIYGFALRSRRRKLR